MHPSIELRIARDHPALPGHFPGQPVVPGVVLLDAVITALAARDISVIGIRKVKFLAPVEPGRCFLLEYDTPRSGCLRFHLLDAEGEIRLAEGKFELS